MHSLLAKVMDRGIFRVPARRKRKVEVKPVRYPHLSLYGSPGRCPLAAPRCPEEKPWLIYAKQLEVANVRFASRASATVTPETTVLAHIRIAGLCGTGIKPPDLIAAIACSSCHDEIDRRTRLVDAEYAKECALEGMARTQVIWMKEGLIKA